MSKTDEYQVPDSVKNDDVAMWSSEEDLLIYSHFYDKGKSEALNSQWVSVKERLPEPETYVMTALSGQISQKRGSICLNYFQKNKSWWDFKTYVTHWQPLPSPPLNH